MAQGVFAITEQRDGAFRKVSYEVVSEGRRIADGLGSDLTAAVLGSGVEGIAAELGKYGADKVVLADDAEEYSAIHESLQPVLEVDECLTRRIVAAKTKALDANVAQDASPECVIEIQQHELLGLACDPAQRTFDVAGGLFEHTATEGDLATVPEHRAERAHTDACEPPRRVEQKHAFSICHVI